MNDLETSMNERKYNVAEILALAKLNPLLDYERCKAFFVQFAPEIDIYKYTGDNDFLRNKMDEELLSDTNGFKLFLEAQTYPDKPIRAYDAILSIVS